MSGHDEQADNKGGAARRSRISMRLRPTLLTVLLGLLLATVTAIGGVAFVKTAESVETLAIQQFAAAARATAARVQGMVDGVPDILREYEVLVQRGVLDPDDKTALGTLFVERLRQNAQLAWIGFGNRRDGSFVGATRRNAGGVSLYVADPAVNGGLPSETLVARSGAVAPVAGVERKPYRVAEKMWFQKAIAAKNLLWLDPYTFTDGRHGVTAALAVTPPGEIGPMGVFDVDLFTDEIGSFLDTLGIGAKGRVHILTRSGETVAQPAAWRDGDPALGAAVRQLGHGLTGLPAGAPTALGFDYDGARWRASFQPFEVTDGPQWVIAVLAPEAEFTGAAVRNAWLTGAAGFVALLVATAIATFVSGRIAVPLRRISEDLERIATFSFDETAPPRSFVREVAVVGEAATRMKASLRSFGRYVPAELVRELLASGREAELGGERRRMTIHFSDIAGFTAIAEGMPPERLVDELGDYFAMMRKALSDHHGTIDKYMGDGILAFFNAPTPLDGHEVAACRAALDAQRRLAADREVRTAAGRPAFSARIGLAVGEVIVGNIGTPDRFAYTVIGDTVNLASRLEGLGKFYGAAILASGELRAATGDAFEWRQVDRVAVFGRQAVTDIHELLGEAGSVEPGILAVRDAHEAALAAYFAGRFAEAEAQFRALGRIDPDDRPAQIMARRARKLLRRAPDGEWTGVYVHARK